MNLPKLQLKRRPLGERGLAHFVAPLVIVLLVAIAGTYMLVASHAATPGNGNGGTAGPAKAASAKKGSINSKGLLLIYGGNGYTGTQVVARNLDTKTHTCGPAWNGTFFEKTLPKPVRQGDSWKINALVLHCTHTSGLEKYEINYKKNGTLIATAIAVDVDSSSCVAVYPNGQEVKSPFTNGKCSSVAIEKIVAKDVTIQVKPSAGSDKKSITGWVDFNASDLTKTECTGQVAMTVTEAPAKVVKQVNLPLKFAPKVTVGSNTYADRCVAQLKFTGLKKGTTYNVTANFAGTVFLKPGANGLNITLPN